MLFAVIVTTGLVLVDFCDLLFGCGCRSVWAGMAEACNVHHAVPPHCPWCAHPLSGGFVAFGAVATAQTFAVLRSGPAGLGVRILLAFAALPAVGGAIGWLQGRWWGYW